MQQLEVNTLDPQSSAVVDGISLQEFLTILRRRRLVVLQSFVIIAVAAMAWTFLTKPVYQASARLLVEASSPTINTVDTSNPFSEILALTQPQSVDTQVEVLQSPSLTKKVQAEVDGLPTSTAKVVHDPTLTVKAVDDTNVIEVTGESTSPQRAADAANRLLQDYIDQDVNQSVHDIQGALDFAKKQEALARKRLNQAEIQLETFKLQHHVAELETDRSKQQDQVASLDNTLLQAQAQMAALSSQLVTTRRELAAQSATVTSDVQTTNSDIELVRQKIADLKLQREGLTQPGGFTPHAPQVRALDAQIAELQKRLTAMPNLQTAKTIGPNPRVTDLQQKVEDLIAMQASQQTTVAAVADQLAQARAKVSQYADWEVQVASLTRQHDDAAATDQMLMSKIAELSLREMAHHPTARINEVAQVPDYPVRPKKTLNIILGMLFGLFIGICMALLQEFLDDRINTVDEAQRSLGLPSLGFVPALNAADAKLLPQMHGYDPAAESYRLLRTNIQFAAIDTPLHTLLVTSASPGEGKTTTAANLAFALALDGKRVLLVDTDLRRPSIHKLLEIPTMPGVTDVLLGRATLEDSMLPNSGIPNLRTLTAGSTPPNPSELLNSHAFTALIGRMAEQNDIVIFDSPPLLVAADAALMASKMDGTVMVVATGDTKKGPARHALSLLRNAHANVLGIAHNKMHTLDGHGYYYYYNYSSSLRALTDDPGTATDSAQELVAEDVKE